MMDYSQPHDVDDITAAFGSGLGDLMPPMEIIPDELKRCNSANKWRRFQMDWFYAGIPKGREPAVKQGIDAKKAWNHLRAIQASWDIKHEHKEAAVAWLASQWLVDYRPEAIKQWVVPGHLKDSSHD